MPLKADNELILAGLEAVYGTAEVLAAADALQCDFEITPMKAQQKTREFSRAYFGARPIIHTEIHRGIKLSNIEFAGSGDASVAPAWSELMAVCGWNVVTTATETTFSPLTDATDSLTINPSIDGEQFQMVGARGSVSFMLDVGEFPVIEAELDGGWVDPETLGALPTIDLSAWKIPVPINCENTAAIQIGGESYPFYSLKIDQNAQREFFCIPGESGSRIEIVSREIKGTVKLQAKTITEHDLFALVKSNALNTFQCQHGTAGGNRLTLTGPAVQLANPRKSDYKNELAWECDLIFTPTAAGDDELILVHD